MSSLRLALKQSLEETAGSVSPPPKARKRGRTREDFGDDINNQNTTVLRNDADDGLSDEEEAVFGSENEFSSKERTYAANKIQSQWKRHHHQHQQETKVTEGEQPPPEKPVTKNVPAPTAEVLEWVRSIPVKRARRHVTAGLRVKVRFTTKIKREGKVIHKKKWFGGRISKVGTGGTKVRIKYDDGTTEVSDFPDKEIVVDDTFNGKHHANANAVKFLPPAGSVVLRGEGDNNAPEQQKELESPDKPPIATESNDEVLVKPKRKRGRPPKHRPLEKPIESVEQDAIAVDESENLKLEAKNDALADPSKPSLVIRIPKLGGKEKVIKDSKSPISSGSPEGGNIPEENRFEARKETKGETSEADVVASKNRHNEDEDGGAPSTRIHIHINPHSTLEDPARENRVDQLVTEDSPSPLEANSKDPSENVVDPTHVTETGTKRKKLSPPGSPQSPRERKRKKKLMLPATLHAPPLANDLGPDVDPNKELVGAMRANEEAVISQEDSFDGNDIVSNSGLEGSGSLDDEYLKVSTPRGRNKQENAPAVRSGRRAAQQANERIVAKQDAKDQGLKKKRRRDRRRDDESVSSEEDSQWVQCDGCKKWRIIPSSAVSSLPNQWFCSLNIWDPLRASCDAPEQTPKQVLKERKKLKKRQKRLLREAAAEGEGGELPRPDLVKERVSDRSRSPRPDVDRRSPADSMVKSSSNGDLVDRQERKFMLGKKGRAYDSAERLPVIEEGQEPKSRGRGRPRRNQIKVMENPPAAGQRDDVDNLEWVQCEKCDKWRKLPPSVSADELPDVWYCSMNTWNPASASCDAPEDKADGLLDIGVFGKSGGALSTKVTYRNLIFGSNGRKANRPISERTRAAESLFIAPTQDEDVAPVVMYANSTDFVSRSRLNQAHEESPGISMFELLSHSKLWSELRAAALQFNNKRDSENLLALDDLKLSCYTFETIPNELKDSMKNLLLHVLGSHTLNGEELLRESRSVSTDNLPEGWRKAQLYCTINVIVTCLYEMVKEGTVECVGKCGEDFTIDNWVPHYRKKSTAVEMPLKLEIASAPRLSRCMKIAKPWKHYG